MSAKQLGRGAPHFADPVVSQEEGVKGGEVVEKPIRKVRFEEVKVMCQVATPFGNVLCGPGSWVMQVAGQSIPVTEDVFHALAGA